MIRLDARLGLLFAERADHIATDAKRTETGSRMRYGSALELITACFRA